MQRKANTQTSYATKGLYRLGGKAVPPKKGAGVTESTMEGLCCQTVADSRWSKADGLRAVQERRYDDTIELLSPQGWPSLLPLSG